MLPMIIGLFGAIRQNWLLTYS